MYGYSPRNLTVSEILYISHLLVPVGFVSDKQEDQCLQECPKYHANPDSLQQQCSFVNFQTEKKKIKLIFYTMYYDSHKQIKQ